MRLSRSFSLAAALTAAFAVVIPASAQISAGTGLEYQGYDFDAGLGADRAQLLLVPVAIRVPVPSVEGLSFDLYSAWAEGRVQSGDSVFKLSGPVDTGLRGAYQATPWALVTVGVNIPTGNSEHDTEEALVASVLSTDILGFHETTWGRGFAVTGSVAVARQVGGFGLGLAGSYSQRGNLFQAGNRIRFDGTYAFRMSGGVWTVYAADLLRQNGDLSLVVLDSQGDSVGVATDQTPRQNLLMGGVTGSVPIGGGFVFRPHIDGRLQSREDAAGSSAGSGWLVGFGGDIPVRLFGNDFFPKARVLLGKIQDPDETPVSVFGLEFSGTVRLNF
jgi:hypothetical protein